MSPRQSHEDAREEDRLAAAAQAGDPRALAALYRRVAPSLLAYLERGLGGGADAEDVLHESFLRLFEGRGRYEGRGRFRSWIFTVASRIALDRMRRSRRHDALAPAVADVALPAAPPDPAAEAAHAELMRRIDGALADLPPAYVMAFPLRGRERFAYREIAAMCGEPEGTLRSRVHHALGRIRKSLEGLGYERPARERTARPSRKERSE